ncbi:MAG TPA: type I glutamate--ammonia ligase [Nitrosopumilaceae archaeon]|nr:type I glutamate--ammonia ligase [Nitrosopumilaceae archaeon]
MSSQVKVEDFLSSVHEKFDYVEFWFVDIFGELHSLSIPTYSLNEEHFSKGIQKLDASSIRGFRSVDDSDLLLKPDLSTFRELPPYYDKVPRRSARIFVNIYDEKENGISRFNKDSRGIATKARNELLKSEIAQPRFGPEIEFFIFDSIRLVPAAGSAISSSGAIGYSIKSIEAPWSQANTSVNLRGGYYTAKPRDTLDIIRKDICDDMYKYFGVQVEAHHHEVASSGQCEINIHHDEMLSMGDTIITIKNLVKVKSKQIGKVATFMPKPIYGDNASAMHVHHSLMSDDKNLFYDPNDQIANLSQKGRYYIGGLLDHASALCAISNPTTNSYKRLVPGFEAPIGICWGLSNRSASIRVPKTFDGDYLKKRIEYRIPDAASNIYLLEAGILLAGLDGIKRKLDPGSPVEEDVYGMTSEKRKSHNIRFLPSTLKDALDALQSDRSFLEPVFTKDFLDTYSSLKYKEYSLFAQTPTAWEVAMYSNI